MTRPLLVVDGDSFAHRAYHALPKTIRRPGNRGAGAILGFANFLLKIYEAEKPRAVLVGWDSLDEPTYRHEALAGYQAGREFDDELVEQLNVLPEFVSACGFANAKAAGYEADDFLAAAVAKEEKRGGRAVVATGDRDAFQLASEKTTILQPVKAGELARIGPAEIGPLTLLDGRRRGIAVIGRRLFSDGLERLVLDFRARTAHGPFFEAVFNRFGAAPRAGHNKDVSSALAELLSSAAVNGRTDGDKSIVCASARIPTYGPPCPAQG
jgi:hypothetical protein